MKDLVKQKKLLLKIERARLILAGELERGFITSKDIVSCFSKDTEYRLSKGHEYRLNVLKNIINCPFLLCDQENLDIDIKKLLPAILKNRFDTEIEELYLLYNNCDITDDELLEEKERLKFCYYESSIDGRQILKNKKVKKIVEMKSVK